MCFNLIQVNYSIKLSIKIKYSYEEAASDLLDNPLTFFANSKKDTTEAIIKCFR